MVQTTTIRSRLEEYIKREEVTLQKLAENSNINPGTLSAIMHANRPIAMRQLDNLTAGMGLQKGELYDLYVNECLVDHNPNWRRLRPFLYQCAELGKLDCIKRVISYVMDNLAYVPLLFETAEDFFQNEKHEAAQILYESVAESERYQHSERLALCQFRLFTLSVGLNQQANLKAAVIFEGYVDRLCEEDQLDALRQLANLYYSLWYWDKVQFYAIEMEKKATIQYLAQKQKRRRDPKTKKTARPIFVYIQYSYLLQGAFWAENKEYEKALPFTKLYGDSSWVIEVDEESEKYKTKFSSWALANKYMYTLLMGETSILPEYLSYIEENEDEVLTALVKIVEAANKFNLDIDYIFDKFDKQVVSSSRDNLLKRQIRDDRYMIYLSQTATYYINKHQINKGIAYLLNCLEVAVKVNNAVIIIDCVYKFEKYREHASNQDVVKYKCLIEELTLKNEDHNEKNFMYR